MTYPVGTKLYGPFPGVIYTIVHPTREGFYRAIFSKSYKVNEWSHAYVNLNWTVISTPNKFLNNFI